MFVCTKVSFIFELIRFIILLNRWYALFEHINGKRFTHTPIYAVCALHLFTFAFQSILIDKICIYNNNNNIFFYFTFNTFKKVNIFVKNTGYAKRKEFQSSKNENIVLILELRLNFRLLYNKSSVNGILIYIYCVIICLSVCLSVYVKTVKMLCKNCILYVLFIYSFIFNV